VNNCLFIPETVNICNYVAIEECRTEINDKRVAFCLQKFADKNLSLEWNNEQLHNAFVLES